MVEQTITRPILPVALVLPLMLLPAALLLVFMIRRKNSVPDIVLTMLRTAALLALVFLINLRPMVVRTEMEVLMKNMDILFVLDTTTSMWAEDHRGDDTRISGAVADCTTIMEKLSGCNYALVTFERKGRILTPFTQGAENVRDALEAVSAPDRYYARGSSLNIAYEPMEELLKYSSEKKDRRTFVFFISDGEITNGDTLMDYKPLLKYVNGGAVLGYGTAAGGRMKDSPAYNRSGTYIRDPATGEDAVSRLDAENLTALAEMLGIDYIWMRRPSDLNRIIASIEEGAKQTLDTVNEVSYEDRYHLFVPAAFALMALSMLRFIRRGRV